MKRAMCSAGSSASRASHCGCSGYQGSGAKWLACWWLEGGGATIVIGGTPVDEVVVLTTSLQLFPLLLTTPVSLTPSHASNTKLDDLFRGLLRVARSFTAGQGVAGLISSPMRCTML